VRSSWVRLDDRVDPIEPTSDEQLPPLPAALAEAASADRQTADRFVPPRVGILRLIGADDLEVLVDEDVVGPVDADVVDLILAVAQPHNTIDDAARVGRQSGFCGPICRGSADDGAGPLLVVRRDLTDLL
jgi:hypothetical protein